MGVLIEVAKGAAPTTIRRYLRQRHREYIFERAVRRFATDPAAAMQSSSSVLDDLIYGWGNEGWSGQREYLEGCIEYALRARGPFLECGSGLTTIVAGLVALKSGYVMWTLEHDFEWGTLVRRHLDYYGIASVRLSIKPLKNVGECDWYDPPFATMPEEFVMVICDGPPSTTRGGRYGLVPVMKDRLASNCVILLDDAVRGGEQTVAKLWAAEMSSDCEIRGTIQPYFVLTRKSAQRP